MKSPEMKETNTNGEVDANNEEDVVVEELEDEINQGKSCVQIL